MKRIQATTLAIATLIILSMAGIVGYAQPAPGSAPSVEERVQAVLERLSDHLKLTDEQRQSISGILTTQFTKFDEIQKQLNAIRKDTELMVNAFLTDEQKEKNFDLWPRFGGGRPFDGPGKPGARGGRRFEAGPRPGGFGKPDQPAGPGRRALQGLDLTDEQKEDIQEILKDDSISNKREEILKILTDEQKEAFQQRREDRPRGFGGQGFGGPRSGEPGIGRPDSERPGFSMRGFGGGPGFRGRGEARAEGREFGFQARGRFQDAPRLPQILNHLDLTDEQKVKIDEIMKSPSGNPREEIMKVLTEEQIKQLQELRPNVQERRRDREGRGLREGERGGRIEQ